MDNENARRLRAAVDRLTKRVTSLRDTRLSYVQVCEERREKMVRALIATAQAKIPGTFCAVAPDDEALYRATRVLREAMGERLGRDADASRLRDRLVTCIAYGYVTPEELDAVMPGLVAA